MDKPIDLEEFRKVLRNLIDDPSVENSRRVDQIRLWFVHSAKMTEGISRQIRGLTRRLPKPNEDDLKIINQMVLSCRHLARSSELLAKDYEIMYNEGILVSEIENFKKACSHLKTATYYIESVYIHSTGDFGLNDPVRSN